MNERLTLGESVQPPMSGVMDFPLVCGVELVVRISVWLTMRDMGGVVLIKAGENAERVFLKEFAID